MDPQNAPVDIIQKTAAFIRVEFADDSSGHDWWHVYRVWKTALAICEREGGDKFVVEMAALLHDLDDWKLTPSSNGTPLRAGEWLEKMGVDEANSAHINEIITHLSFKGAGVSDSMPTLEGQIVQDADRLDAIGAIGIARAFAYGGHKGRAMYDPAEAPTLHQDFEQYQRSQGHTINHFYEKLLLLRHRMNTDSARQIAAERHAFMESFLRQFFREWQGDEFSEGKRKTE